MSTIAPYTGDGTTDEFDITFDYRKATTIKVRVNGVDVGFTFVNGSRIKTNAPPAAATLVEVYRATPVAEPEVVFVDGQVIHGSDLNDAVAQSREKAEEMGSEIDNLSDRTVKMPAGESPVVFPTLASRINKVLGFDGSGNMTALARFDAGVGPLAADVPNAHGGTVQDAIAGYRTFQSFGAKGDYNVGTGVGTDDTAAIQDAINWAYANGKPLRHTGGNFLCGQITLYPTVTIIGDSRQVSAFWCKTGTTNVWWGDRGNGAQKITLVGLGFYGRGNTNLTHLMQLGTDPTKPFGTEGWIDQCWFRDGPNAYGLWVDGNIGLFGTNTFESCARNLYVQGFGNFFEQVISMQPGKDKTNGALQAIGIETYGSHRIGSAEVEATYAGGLPIKMRADAEIANLIISSTPGFSLSHLIEVTDAATYPGFAIQNVRLSGNATPVTNGILSIDGVYKGGTDPAKFIGSTYLRNLAITGTLEIGGRARQSFGLKFRNTGGTLSVNIGSQADPETAGKRNDRVIGSTHVQTTVVAGVGGGFTAGIAIDGAGRIILNTATQDASDADLTAVLTYNNTGTALTVLVTYESIAVGGVAKVRPVLNLRDTSGASVAFNTIADTKQLSISLSGFLA